MEPNVRARGLVFRLGSSVASAAAIAERSARVVRLIRAATVVGIVMAIGTWGYWYLPERHHTVVEALYMTVISISTVGFNEVIPIDTDTMRGFTMGIILVGGASVVYFLTAVAAYVVEGDFLYGLWRRRLRAKLRAVRGHVIVCGLGRVGQHTFAELHSSNVLVVGIDRDPMRVETLLNARGPHILFMVGDAADEEVLNGLGVARARTLVAALADDRDNFLLCVTARQLNPDIRLMVRLVDPAHAAMFDDLAADSVVYPPALSGVRLANELLRPQLTAFTDRLLSAGAHLRTLCEVEVPARSSAVGADIAQLDLDSSSGALLLGVRRAGASPDSAFPFGPTWDSPLEAGDTLVVLADRAQLGRLGAQLEGRPPRRKDRAASAEPVRVSPRPNGSAELFDRKAPSTGHVVVAGVGAVGRSAVQEILRQNVPVTVIDRSASHIALLGDKLGEVRVVTGDVTQPSALAATDLANARGFITALQPLRDNLFLAATVHHQNAHARVVSRVGNEAEGRRLRAVGAAVVNPGLIGGVNLAHRMTRPELVDFARGLEASWSHAEQLAVVTIGALPAGSPVLDRLEVHARTGCVVLGYRRRASGAFSYHPPPLTRLHVGGAFIALGEPAQIDALRTLVR